MKEEKKNYILIDDASVWEENPREISPKDFESLKKKIKRWGIWKPFLVWESKKVILGGNSRYKACKELGHKKIWVEYREPKDEAEALEMAIADNESSGEWIISKLTGKLKEYEGNIDYEDYKVSLGSIRTLNLINEPDDPVELYKGITDFESKDSGAWKDLIVHFENEEDYKEFSKLIEQGLTEKTKYIWFPLKAKRVYDNYGQ